MLTLPSTPSACSILLRLSCTPPNCYPLDVYVYYKDGGVRKLFRKVKNISSAFYPEETQVRQKGNYVYEQFFEPYNHADVKVYGVGKFFHAESRKAPHIDGIVERDARGRERRDVVSLSSQETCHLPKSISRLRPVHHRV